VLAARRTGATVGGMVGRAAGLALVLMLVQNSGFVLVMRYSRHQQQGENAAQYNPAVVVAMQEALQAGLTPSPKPKPQAPSPNPRPRPSPSPRLPPHPHQELFKLIFCFVATTLQQSIGVALGTLGQHTEVMRVL